MRSAPGGSILRRHRAWLTPIALLVALWIPGVTQGGFRVDTGVYAAIGLHAWRDGSPLPLWAGDQLYFNKPPLAFWIHGALLHALGPHLWVARLGSLLAATGGVIATVLAARALLGHRAALWSGLVLALTLEYFRYTHAISLDLWLACWVMAGFAAVAPMFGVARPEPGARRWVLAGSFWGLALLTKPFLGLVAPLLLCVWSLAGTRRKLLPRVLLATAVSVLVALPWHLWMIRRFGDAFTNVYFGKQTLERAAGGRYADEAWWFYPALLAQTYWPWLVTFVLGAAAAFGGRMSPIRRTGLKLALTWCAAWLVALTLFGGKSGRYAIILYPFAAWLSAAWICGARAHWAVLARRAIERWLAPAALVMAALVALSGARIHAPEDPQWATLRERLRSEHEICLWTPPDLLWSTANVYLSEGWWPRTARTNDRPELSGTSDPPDGGLMLFRDDGRYLPREADAVVWRSGRLMLVRTRGEWDGTIPRNPRDPRADGPD